MFFERDYWSLRQFLAYLKEVSQITDSLKSTLAEIGNDVESEKYNDLVNLLWDIRKKNLVAEDIAYEMKSKKNSTICQNICENIWSVIGKNGHHDFNVFDLTNIAGAVDSLMITVDLGIKRVNRLIKG